MLAGAGKSLIDRSNGCTFVIGSVQQRPTKIHLGNVDLFHSLRLMGWISNWQCSDRPWRDSKAFKGIPTG